MTDRIAFTPMRLYAVIDRKIVEYTSISDPTPTPEPRVFTTREAAESFIRSGKAEETYALNL